MNTSRHVLNISGYARADQTGIHGCMFDDVTGELTVRGSFAGIVNPSFLCAHPHGRWLYAVSETRQQKETLRPLARIRLTNQHHYKSKDSRISIHPQKYEFLSV